MQKIKLPNLSKLFGILITFSLLIAVTYGYLHNALAGPTPKILLGLGTEAVDSINSQIVKDSPIKMLSSWFNTTEDLSWMGDQWHRDFIKDAYAKGYTMHVITFNNDAEDLLTTSGGTACGRGYPLTPQFITDMEKLSDIFKGDKPIYFTLNTEFQDYPCVNNQWAGNEAYFNAMKANYLLAMQKIREVNPNAQVSLGWGGWQSRFDDTITGAGVSLFPHFEDVMRQSQFQSFQAMQSDSNLQDIKDMSKILGGYGPVMVAHFKPDNGSQSTFDTDIRTIFTDSYLTEVLQNGLFALSFMDDKNINASTDTFNFLKSAVTTYGADSANPSQPTVTPTAEPSSSVTSSPSPTNTPPVSITPLPTIIVSPTPTIVPTSVPTLVPTVIPTIAPTPLPATPAPTITPTSLPQPVITPTAAPTTAPTPEPTVTPTSTPNPTLIPVVTINPTPTLVPQPTLQPSPVLGATTSPTASSIASINPTAVPPTSPLPSPSSNNNGRGRGRIKNSNDHIPSIIKIFARGTSALGVYPEMELVVNEKPVRKFIAEASLGEYTYMHPVGVSHEQVKIKFLNDAYIFLLGQDRNLKIDKISINGDDYETESPAVYSVGTWSSENGCESGHKDSEWLKCGGYVQY
jgi:hypothetical protein